MDRNRKTHYEILEVDPSSSAKQIRSSFLTLSKKYHPDTNCSDPALHEKFVQINEAYSVLSNSTQRRFYDNEMKFRRHTGAGAGSNYEWPSPVNRNYSYHRHGYDDFQNFRWKDESIHPNNNRKRYYYNFEYYGIKGVHRKSNGTVAAGACILMIIGACLHYCAFKKTRSTLAASKLRKNEELMEQLRKTTNARNSNTTHNVNNETIARLLQKSQ